MKSIEKIVLTSNSSWNLFNFRLGLIRELIKRGYIVVVLTPKDNYSIKLEEEGCIFEDIDIWNSSINPLNDLRTLFSYCAKIKNIAPNLILTYTAKTNIYCSIATRFLGIPTINNITGIGSGFLRGLYLRSFLTLLYKFALRKSHLVFFQNQEDLNLFDSLKITKKLNTKLIPGSGINIRYFEEFEKGTNPRKNSFIFLMISRIIKDKGVREFVDAARKVKKKFPNSFFKILGNHKSDNISSINKEILDKWKREKVVEFVEFSNDIRPHICNSDCIVLPSYREGLPKSLLEGMIMEKPIIASDVPGCKELVINDFNGYLCKVRNEEDLAKQMIKMLNLSESDRIKMGLNGKKFVEEKYDENFIIDVYLEEISKL